MKRSGVSFSKVFIVGTGLIGSSVGLALKGKAERLGADKSGAALEQALELNAIDRAVSVSEGLSVADLVIIAIPVQFIPHFIESHTFRAGATVLDVGSTKRKVIEAMRKLPKDVYFAGGHPIAGKEKGGARNADALLFKGKPFILAEESRLPEEHKKAVLNFVRLLSAYPVWLSAEKHDEILGLVSHLPYAVSLALFSYVMQKDENALSLAGSGLRDTTRIASGDPVMSAGMLQTNADNVKKFITEFIDVLTDLRDAIDSGELEKIADRVKKRRDKIWD